MRVEIEIGGDNASATFTRNVDFVIRSGDGSSNGLRRLRHALDMVYRDSRFYLDHEMSMDVPLPSGAVEAEFPWFDHISDAVIRIGDGTIDVACAIGIVDGPVSMSPTDARAFAYAILRAAREVEQQ